MANINTGTDGDYFDTTFFDTEYRGKAIGLGFTWFVISILPSMLYSAGRPGYARDGWSVWWMTAGTWHAW